ncbi:MAG: MBL fold metallo-hydrolase [Chitinophagales bacterium]|nr:MBL fold metallo-hydrolase [Chitinophagales bacterium]MDW8418104.1 MBL fold metallo-hydrolase [Chitinophagales bacterium]
MRVTFLGTGTSGGVPLIGCRCEVCLSTDPRDKRLRTSIMIEEEDLRIVVDCGPDFRQQMLRTGVDRLDAILFTHAHKDHTGGIDDIRSFNFIMGKPLDFYCDYATELGIKEQYAYAFSETDYPYLPKMTFHRIDDEHTFYIRHLAITPIRVMHGPMPVLGFRFGEKFTYITDAKTITPEERRKITGTKILVLNALRETEHYSHFTIRQAIEIVEDIRPETCYFIHMSHQFGLHAQMEKKLPPNIKISYDGLQILI